MKKVICLYRVSTIGQVDHDDIPMQRLACREYAKTHPDWEIIDEISEKGISGYKVSATDRDAIVEIKKRAAQHQFDVLLVFMFDRLGRRDDETPFVVQWFVQQGIEVWSAREGEQQVRKPQSVCEPATARWYRMVSGAADLWPTATGWSSKAGQTRRASPFGIWS